MLRLPLFDTFQHLVSYGFSERSDGNMSVAVGNPVVSEVIENRKRFLSELGLVSEKLVKCTQVHGTEICVVTETDAGRGAFSNETAVADFDGLITDVKGIPLGITVADCAAVIFFDPVHQVIGIAHCGWRGSVGKICSKLIAKMHDEFGSDPKNILVGIGPQICVMCYPVGEEVIAAGSSAFGEKSAALLVEKTDGVMHFDLISSILIQLFESGIDENHVESIALCTKDNPEQFFSYRNRSNDPAYGLQLGVIGLRV